MAGFAFDMNIDPDGIILVTLKGVFDFDKWRAARQHLLDTRFAGVNFHGRPSIIDMTESEPPESGWARVFLNVHQELAKVGEGTGPTAFVVDDDPVMSASIRFFLAVGETKLGNAPDTITCKSVEDARRWLMESDGWRSKITD